MGCQERFQPELSLEVQVNFSKAKGRGRGALRNSEALGLKPKVALEELQNLSLAEVMTNER